MATKGSCILEINGDQLELKFLKSGNNTVEDHFVIVKNDLPTASFTAEATCNVVTIINNSSSATHYLWDYGDGQTLEGNPAENTHPYDLPGTYTITLTVTNDNGCESTYEQTITITPCGDATFTGGQDGCSNNLHFTSADNPAGVTHQWFFNGVLFSTEQDPDMPITTATAEGFQNIMHTVLLNGTPIDSHTETIELYHIDQFGDITVNTNQNWSIASHGNNYVIAGSVTIQPTRTLTIANGVTVRFCGNDKRLIIQQGTTTSQQGGKLFLNGTLTDFQGQTWQDIEVRGSGVLPQMISSIFGTTRQGQLIGSSTAIIQNAQVGVRNYNNSLTTQSGGVIRCTGTTFLNNRIGAEFRKYPSNITQTSGADYNARFKNCTFEVDDAYLDEVLPAFNSFIFLREVRYVQIESSHFRNNMTVSENNPTILSWGTGIRAFSASFRLNAPTNVISGTVIPRSSFSGLGYGIWAYTKAAPTAPFIARLSDFNNCVVGLRNQGITGTTTLFNDFNMGTLPTNAENINDVVQAGILYEGRMDINECQENTFINDNPNANQPIVGIRCQRIGIAENIIRRNTFDGLTTGNMALGGNGNEDEFFPEGLNYLCNTNNNVEGFDIDVAQQDGTTLPSSIRLTQGLGSNMAAGNLFSDPASVSTATGIFNSGNTQITYWVDDLTSLGNLVPSFAPLGSVNNTDINITENTCLTEYCEPPCGNESEIAGFKSDYYAAKAAYPQLQANYTAKPNEENALAIMQARQQMDYTSRMVVLHLLADTLGYDPDSLYLWVSNKENLNASYWLSDMYLNDGNISAALATLDDIPNKYSLSSSQSADLQSYRNVTNLLAGQDLDNLNQSTISFLASYDQSGGQTETFVKRILANNDIHYAPEFAFSEAGAGQNDDKQFQNIETTSNIVEVAPNPAKDFVIFRLHLEDELTTGSLEVRDMNGRLLLLNKIEEGVQSLKWNTEHLPSGIYFYQLKTASGNIQSGKLVLSK